MFAVILLLQMHIVLLLKGEKMMAMLKENSCIDHSRTSSMPMILTMLTVQVFSSFFSLSLSLSLSLFHSCYLTCTHYFFPYSSRKKYKEHTRWYTWTSDIHFFFVFFKVTLHSSQIFKMSLFAHPSSGHNTLNRIRLVSQILISSQATGTQKKYRWAIAQYTQYECAGLTGERETSQLL